MVKLITATIQVQAIYVDKASLHIQKSSSVLEIKLTNSLNLYY